MDITQLVPEIPIEEIHNNIVFCMLDHHEMKIKLAYLSDVFSGQSRQNRSGGGGLHALQQHICQVGL